MKLSIHPILGALLLAAILILLVALIKGCNQSKLEVADKEKAVKIADSVLVALNAYKVHTDSTEKLYKDSLEFSRGQEALTRVQKERTENDLNKSNAEVDRLLDKYKYAKYTDTTMVSAPKEFIEDCHDCYLKLDNQNKLVNKFRSDVNNIQSNWDQQTKLYQKRFKELDEEKLGFTNKISALAKAQQDALDKLKPHGRLYLSWGVQFQPWPKYAGAGLMYQNKRNLIWGAMWYYGTGGHMVQTTINFPLSLKFR